MRILFVVRSIGYGGASKQLALTANAMAEMGHTVCIYSYNWNELGQELYSSVKYVPEANVVSTSIWEYFLSPFRIRKQIKRFHPEIIVSWRANAGCMTVLANIGLSPKTVFSERTDPYMETNWMLKIATKIADISDGGVFQTDGARVFYKRLAKKSVVIPNFTPIVPLQAIIPFEERVKEIVCVSRLFVKQKRQDILLEAFKIVHERHPEYSLKLYGDGDGLVFLKHLAENLGIGDCVKFMGAVNHITEHIKSAKVLALSSDYEGIPNVLLEAMSVGVPVVTTDTSPGGARLIVKNGLNGFVVPIGDSEKLADKIIFLIENIETANLFIENGFKRLDDFSNEAIAYSWENYLEKIAVK